MDDSTNSSPPPPPEASRPPPWPRWIVWVLPVLLVLFLTYNQGDGGVAGTSVPYTTFYHLVEEGDVASVALRGDRVTAKLLKAHEVQPGTTTTQIRTRLPAQEDLGLVPMLRAQNVEVEVLESEPSTVVQVFFSLLPWLVILGAWWWLSRRMVSTGAPFGGMIKPGARTFEAVEKVDVTFDDVAGQESAKRDLREVVDFLKNPERFERLGGKLPRGVLLMGSPGTGKTLLARAVAGEAGVPFFSISGSEFIELFVGVGASRVRDLFSAAKKAAPAIVFIDEIDAVGRSRGTGLGGGHDEREQTLNQLLAAMDGFEKTLQVVVLAATNRPDVLDPALLRPGRFDRRVVVDLPEIDAREAILRVHTRDKPLAADVDLRDVARTTPGFSGADLANLANEAALHALRRGADTIAMQDLLEAQDKVQLGDPRETRLSVDEKERVAVHEAGHALVADRTAAAEPLRRVTIIPRGMALGATQQAPVEDRHLMTQSQLEGRLRVLLGGYVAERMMLGEVSTGAEHDLRQATELAEKMVARFGMSDVLGPVYVEQGREHPFLGAKIATDAGVSEARRHEVEAESRRFLERARDEAEALIGRHRGTLERLIVALMDRETLEQEALREVLDAAPAAPSSGTVLSDEAALGHAISA